MESSPFIEKMNEVCEFQLTSQEYNPIILDEHILRTLTPEEVKKTCFSIKICRYTLLIIPNIAIHMKSNTIKTWFQKSLYFVVKNVAVFMFW